MPIPKEAYLLSFFSRHYHKIMKLKCKARRYLSVFSCNWLSHMTSYVNFKLSKDVEKNLGSTQYNTDHHEVIIRPFMQNHRSTIQFSSIQFFICLSSITTVWYILINILIIIIIINWNLYRVVSIKIFNCALQ